MKIIKSAIIAFSTYSKIPMPQFEWKEEDMKYIFCFFPWVGAVIGLGVWLWSFLCQKFEIGSIAYCFIGVAIPIFLTGGIHVDGFMDSMDAFHSYQPKEKKLEILKDPHIGAFSVIMLALYLLVYVGAFSEITNSHGIVVLCGGFVLSRCLSGIGVISFPSAKSDGMLYTFADSSHKIIVRVVLYIQLILCVAFMTYFGGIISVILAFLTFGYYYFKCKKELGGITGDTAGYFVLLCELAICIGALH